ncbi:uncharacterized protein [Eurosta solidaginis]|uniref:uncharacterized protein n=1 Tax=Eurosta solidaginis TaxID=178769 RepID=UPI003530E265
MNAKLFLTRKNLQAALQRQNAAAAVAAMGANSAAAAGGSMLFTHNMSGNAVNANNPDAPSTSNPAPIFSYNMTLPEMRQAISNNMDVPVPPLPFHLTFADMQQIIRNAKNFQHQENQLMSVQTQPAQTLYCSPDMPKVEDEEDSYAPDPKDDDEFTLVILQVIILMKIRKSSK